MQPNFFQWRHRYETGNELIDAEHRALWEKLKLCFEASRNGLASDSLILQLRDIHASMHDHFRDEEKFMAEADKPEFHAHRQQHRYLLDCLMSKIGELGDIENRKITVQEVLFYLRDWYDIHLITEDKKLFLPSAA